MFSAASSYFPTQVSGMMSQDRAFATVHLLTSGQRNVCTMAVWAPLWSLGMRGCISPITFLSFCVFVPKWLKWIICCFRIQKLPRLLVATDDGQLFIYNVDPLDGGECMLAHKHRWGYSWCHISKMDSYVRSINTSAVILTGDQWSQSVYNMLQYKIEDPAGTEHVSRTRLHLRKMAIWEEHGVTIRSNLGFHCLVQGHLQDRGIRPPTLPAELPLDQVQMQRPVGRFHYPETDYMLAPGGGVFCLWPWIPKLLPALQLMWKSVKPAQLFVFLLFSVLK